VSSVSAVIPVKDGERHLAELLSALAREGVDETLVIDSGSRDRSLQIARSAGVALIEIAPETFAHGTTRNLGAERTTGDLICFLTQDATPIPGWLAAYREAFALAPRVGAAYGPHLPRPETSPMIARELVEYFATFAPDGQPAVQSAGDPTFLSNVNACYARACWEELRFRELPYAEDQAFGADLLAAGWSKIYHPGAAVLHAHDYGLADFMRRYFDEYRGLRDATGHVEPFAPGAILTQVGASVRADRGWMRAHGMGFPERARWTVRSVAHHGGRKVFSALGSRADTLPSSLQRTLSLEQRGVVAQPAEAAVAPALASQAGVTAALAAGSLIEPRRQRSDFEYAAEVWRLGPAPLLEPVHGMADRKRLRIAMIIPPFRRGSGGHNTLFQIFSCLERRGHVCSVWVHDYDGQLRDTWSGTLRHDIIEFFAPIKGAVYKDFEQWHGADVVISTGWQTVHPVLRLDRCSARAYVVNDHEPEFFGASSERVLAADTYSHGLHCLAASPWLRDLLIDRYGATADAFQLGVDHQTYWPRSVQRRTDTIVYYARPETPRRAVPIGLMALAELHRRRPEIRILLFGGRGRLGAAFPYEHLGVLSPEQLSWLYSEATVGLCLSLTNFSLMPKEMLACGLPCVELAGVSAESIFGAQGPIELAALDPLAIADALERLLDDRELRQRRSREGATFVAPHTWEHATDEIEAGLRHALRLRETVEPGGH
jgi:glycosyltransferase involved in cell wall biosynthesis/GT2 family glycosyltransferase